MQGMLTLATIGLVLSVSFAAHAEANPQHPTSLYDFTMKSIDGQSVDLSKYKGKVVLVVNVASKCGYTPQYEQLEKVYKEYKDQGFVILGFPANEFGHQEPGSNAEIKQFCTAKYDVTFDMFSKIVVKGEGIVPLYQWLTDPATKTGGPIGWNFTKFLIGKDGKIVARYESKVKPDDAKVIGAIKAELDK